MQVASLILNEVKLQQLALEGLQIIVNAGHTLGLKMSAQGCNKDVKEAWDQVREQM